jgi:N-acetylmuramoyl-L-alanine amidase
MFLRRGHRVTLTRTTAQDGKSLEQRCAIAKRANPNVMLSLHCDSATTQAYEMRCYYRGERVRSRFTDADLAKSIADNAPQILKRTPSIIIPCAPKTMDLKIGIAPRAYNVLRGHGDYPAILIECGFISQRHIAEYLQSPDGRVATAQGICDGVLKHFGLYDDAPKTPPFKSTIS